MNYYITSIISVLIFILGFASKVIYDMWIRKTERRNEALKIHFAELEEQYIRPASQFLNCISNSNGVLEFYNEDVQYTIDAAKTSWPKNNLSGNFPPFRVHFTDMANELLRLEKEVKSNNEKNGAFNTKITSWLEKKSDIQVRDYFKKSNLKVPFFSTSVVTFIRFAYMEHLRIQSSDRFNFREVEYSSDQLDSNIFNITLRDGRELAKVNNVDEAERCKDALIEIGENVDLIEEGQSLYKQAEELASSSKKLSKSFSNICEIYGKFGGVLKKNKKCSICKLIH